MNLASKPGRLAVGVIGAGRVGAVLASALRAQAHDVVAVSAASPASLERLEVLLPGVPVRDMVDVARAADLVLLTVPDDALADVTAWLAAEGGFRPGQLICHTSARFGTGVLGPAQAAGAITLALHPAITFTGTSIDLSRIVGAPFAVTAPALIQPIGQALVVELGGEPVLVPESARAAYDAALTHVSDHLITLVSQAAGVLRASGVTGTAVTEEADDVVARLLGPLARAALEAALARGEAALAGPIARADSATLASHLRALAEAESPQVELEGVELEGEKLPQAELPGAAAARPEGADGSGGGVRDSYVAVARAATGLAREARRIDAAESAALLRLLSRDLGSLRPAREPSTS